MLWYLTHKGDLRCVRLADRHYSRQQPGTYSFTRPGYNMVLHLEHDDREAVFVWWRPAWELPNIERLDKLRAIECTIFRNETTLLSSSLILEACQAVLTWDKYEQGTPLITGINSTLTQRGRSKRSQPGQCFIHAGFTSMQHSTKGVADTWLQRTLDDLQPEHPRRMKVYREQRSPGEIKKINLDRAIKQYLKGKRQS